MILSDREIRAALARGALRMTPPPTLERYSSMAVDFTLGSDLRQWKELNTMASVPTIRPGSPHFHAPTLLDSLTEQIRISDAGFSLKPGQLVLGWTIEKIQLPEQSRLAARVEGKSSLARLGLGVHVTAPIIHAGFGFKASDQNYEGTSIQLEIWNVGLWPIILDPGIAICQLVFEEVHGTPELGYSGVFAQQGPQQP
jgi:dCTP deaminase